MLKVNEYFDGRVKSIALQTSTLPATVGVMEKGEYTFGTGAKETMHVVSGELSIQFPGESAWQTFTDGQVFEVEANASFNVRAIVDTAYFCQYWTK
jgi:purine/pyrimidine-nucleoside phosphorylase